ncbi:hypothetical protein ABEF95_016246 [Exophiala dermatitidis]
MASASDPTEQYVTNMPLTPGDSENEEPSEPSQMAGRKRSASEMEDDSSRSKRTNTGSGADTGLGSSANGANTDTSPAPGPDASETIEAESGDEFTVQCPARRKHGKAAATDDVYIERDAPPEAPDLSIEFAVRPGKKWASLDRFRNAKFKNPLVVVYTTGQVVYINRHNPVPPPPPADATDDEKLQYDKENFWVGLIAEFRAESHAKVYARVWWFYWPEELPMGRQPYHGKQELILSNYTDIIEAHAIACHAEVSFWDENDDSNQLVLQERYWRQTLDVTKLGPKPSKSLNALSKLRTFCICGGYDNPNVEMYQCRSASCGMWNHDACLVNEIERRAWEQFKKGSLTHEVQDKQQEKGFTQKVGETLGHIVHLGRGKSEAKDETYSKPISAARGGGSVKKHKGGKNPWAGKLKGKIIKVQDDTHAAIVTQLVPNADSKPGQGRPFEPKVWNMKMSCLKCEQPLN